MTPRQVVAYSILAERRIMAEKAGDLNLASLATHADAKTLKQVTRSLLKED